jgi:hypothetical protein
LEKEKHGATFATLENNLMSNRILTDTKTTRSDAFFRFTVTGTLLEKEKHGATFAILENNLVSNRILTDAKITYDGPRSMPSDM